MFSISFDEEDWVYFITDDRKKGEESVLAEVFDIETAEVIKKMYEDQFILEKEALNKHFDKIYSDDEGPSWRTEDTLGGE